MPRLNFPARAARLPALVLATVALWLLLLSCAPPPDVGATGFPLAVFDAAQDGGYFRSRAALRAGTRLMAIPENFWPPPREVIFAPEPIMACPQHVLAWPQMYWRDPRFEVFRWNRFPTLLIFDTADYDVQDRCSSA